jgi:predicted DNA-binding protein YlxM (UPF0122 family)
MENQTEDFDLHYSDDTSINEVTGNFTQIYMDLKIYA